jgi:hypothetical protein
MAKAHICVSRWRQVGLLCPIIENELWAQVVVLVFFPIQRINSVTYMQLDLGACNIPIVTDF